MEICFISWNQTSPETIGRVSTSSVQVRTQEPTGGILGQQPFVVGEPHFNQPITLPPFPETQASECPAHLSGAGQPLHSDQQRVNTETGRDRRSVDHQGQIKASGRKNQEHHSRRDLALSLLAPALKSPPLIFLAVRAQVTLCLCLKFHFLSIRFHPAQPTRLPNSEHCLPSKGMHLDF